MVQASNLCLKDRNKSGPPADPAGRFVVEAEA